MKKRNIIVIICVFIVLIVSFIWIAYIIDSRQITTHADIDSNQSAQDLKELPSPDQSIISRIYTSIVNVFK